MDTGNIVRRDNINFMHPITENKREEMIDLCKQHNVKKLYAFGSIVRDDFTTLSDVDLLAEFNNKLYLNSSAELSLYFDNMDSLWEKLENIFDRKVDLFTENNIKNTYLRQIINNEKKLIYAQA